MKRHLFLAIAFLGSAVLFAQKSEQDSIIKNQNIFLKDLKSDLQTKKELKANKMMSRLKDSKQFFLTNDFLKNYAGLSEKQYTKASASDIYNKMTNKKNAYTSNVSYVPAEKVVKVGDGKLNKKKEIKEKEKFSRYNTSSEIYVASVKDSVPSNAKYNVTYNWLIEYNVAKEKMYIADYIKENINKAKELGKSKEELEKIREVAEKKANEEIKSNRIIKKITLVGVTPKSIAFMPSERETMQNAVKTTLEAWYANLSVQQVAFETKDSIISVDKKEGLVEVELPNERNIKVSSVPMIKVNVDPYVYIPEGDENLYTNPNAYYELKPIFTIKISDDLKTAEIQKVEYTSSLVKPTTDEKILSKLEQNKEASKETVNEFVRVLTAYAGNQNKDSRKDLEVLFADKTSLIQVSNLSKDGKESIKNRKANQYISNFNSSELKFDVNDVIFDDQSMNTGSVLVKQSYKSKSYSDQTTKKIYIKKSSTDESKYLIDKIEVIPGSTTNLE